MDLFIVEIYHGFRALSFFNTPENRYLSIKVKKWAVQYFKPFPETDS
jgi:hypothetical protein